MYQFKKASVPENLKEKANFCEKLMTYGVSLKQYEAALAQDDITM